MKDVFKHIHELSRREEYQSILDLLLTNLGTSVQSPYDTDINHAWYLAGDAYFRLGDFQRAVSAFKKAKESWDGDRDAVLALANSYSELGLPEQSDKVLREGLVRWRDDNEMLYNLANALFDQERFKEAIACYQKIVDDPDLGGMAKSNIKAAKQVMKRERSY